MAGSGRRKALTLDEVARLPAGLARYPQGYDWYAALWLLEARNTRAPRIGEAGKAAEEYIRLGQRPLLRFPEQAIAGLESGGERKQGGPWLMQYFFGVFGANGPLPLHLTEYAIERERTRCQVKASDVSVSALDQERTGQGASEDITVEDQVFTRFVNLFHHRLLSLHYRSWRTARPAQDMPGKSGPNFTDRLLSLEGAPAPAWSDALTGLRRAHVATLGSAVRSVDAFERLLAAYTGAQVVVMPLEAVWQSREDDQLSLLGSSQSRLGGTLQLGRRVRMVQSSVHLEIGPLDMGAYQRFLPGTPGGMALSRLLRHLAGPTLSVSARLTLARESSPVWRLGRGKLGRDSWIGNSGSRQALVGCMLYPD